MSAPAPLLVPALFVVIWATGFVAARFVSPHAEAFTFVAIRVVLVALVLGALALARGARWPRDRAGSDRRPSSSPARAARGCGRPAS